MPLITKIHKAPIGDFTIKFSLRSNKFEIEYPTENTEIHDQLTNRVIERNYDLFSWDDVEKELANIVQQYRTKIIMTRKVIIIKLQTSESDYTFTHTNNWFGKVTTKEKMYDHMDDGEGFRLFWYVAEEYQYPNVTTSGSKHLRYRIIETNKNNRHRDYHMNNDTTNILPQLLQDDYNGKVRVYDYSDELYKFLLDMEQSIRDMLYRMIDYFSPDDQKFLTNIVNQTKLLPNATDSSGE